jgi:hypothetical protein
MTYKTSTSSLRTIRLGEPKFLIQDGLVMAPRAGFEISDKCPREYKLIINECLGNGWLKPVATIKDSELFWEEFSK